MNLPKKSIEEIKGIKERYDTRLHELLWNFEKEVGIDPFDEESIQIECIDLHIEQGVRRWSIKLSIK